MKKVVILLSEILIILVILGFVALFTTSYGHDIRRVAAESILSSQHRSLAQFTFLPKEELEQIQKEIDYPEYVNSANLNQKGEVEVPNEMKNGFVDDGKVKVEVETIEKTIDKGHYYKGKILTVSNPKAVKLVSSSQLNHGEQIFVLAKKANALAAVNASGFNDPSGHGNGGTATGIIIEDGKIKNSDPNKNYYVAGLTKDSVMITGFHSANELIEMGVVYAAGFKPQLIVNGKKMVTNGDGGWGIGPRTAMGQKADGTLVFVVIDGRQAHSIGATIKEVQDILYERGCVNAMAMDGGSSASMYFNGENITIPSSKGHIPRYLPNIWAVVTDSFKDVTVIEDGKEIVIKKK